MKIMSNKTKYLAKNNRISEIDDHIRKNFDIKKRLGKGAYGIVWKALDRKTQQTVAVKKIFDAFRNETDAQRTFREIMFLRAFRNHPNIVQLFSIHRATNHMDIYLSFEFMESDLHNVIKRGSILKDIHKRYVMYQLLNATNFIHSGNVIHRDMKPSNVLVDSKCRCKLADFGLARSLSPNHQTVDRCASVGEFVEPCLTDYVATRWYRAPEILIANKSYTKGIDMWSLGCILGEMCRGKPLFPGSCTVNQVECILSALPAPTENDLKSVGNGFGSVLLNQSSKVNGIGNTNPTMHELLVDSPNDAKDLINSLLVLDPTKRLTAKQALYHKYVEKFRNTSPELELTADIVPPFRDDIQLSVAEYRSKLYEIMSSSEKKSHSEKRNSLDKRTPAPSSSPIKSDSSTIIAMPTNGNSKKSLMTFSNARLNSILPKAVAAAQPPPHLPDKTLIAKHMSELKKSHKGQTDIKSNSQSNLFQPKSNIGDTTKTTSNHPPAQKTLNGSYARLTNKLNCCRSCIQDTDESNTLTNPMKRVSAKVLLMPKLKPDHQHSSNSIDSNANFRSDEEPIYKGGQQADRKRSIISASFRRNSMNANSLLKKSSFTQSFDEDAQIKQYYRRQSLDDSITDKAAAANEKIFSTLSSTKENPNGLNYSCENGNMAKHQLPTSLSNVYQTRSNDNKTFIKQMSVDDCTDTDTRLRTLEMKMRKHKIDVFKFVNDQQQSNTIIGQSQNTKKLLAGGGDVADTYFHSKLNPFNGSVTDAKDRSTKLDYAYPKLSVDNVLQNNRRTLKKSPSMGNGNYGVISASDLFKLRSAPERIT